VEKTNGMWAGKSESLPGCRRQ